MSLTPRYRLQAGVHLTFNSLLLQALEQHTLVFKPGPPPAGRSHLL